MEQLNNLFLCFSNKDAFNKPVTVKKPCILKYIERKTKTNKANLEIFFSFFLFDLISRAWKQHINYYGKKNINVTLGLTFLSLMSVYWCKNYALNFKKRKLYFKNTCKELQKPSVSNTYSIGLNHDAELSYKKLIQNIKPFWRSFVWKNQTIWLA